MKMEINVLDFVTDEQRKRVVKMIDEAIDNLDQTRINNTIADAVNKEIAGFAEYWIEDVDFTESNNALSEKINKIIVEGLK